jgi:hypothetical protein
VLNFLKIACFAIQGVLHLSSFFFALVSAWEGDWAQATMFATIAFATA